MPSKRATKITEYLRHEFTQPERLEMGSGLADAHNRLASIEEEEAVMKAQIKERKSTIEQTIGTLARNLGNGFEMRNVVCTLEWDKPNVGEVSYRREDNGEFVKVRAMTEAERQMDLPLDTDAQVAQSVDNSEAAADEFFKPGRPTEQPTAESAAPITESGPTLEEATGEKEPQPLKPAKGKKKSGPKDLAAQHEKEGAAGRAEP